MFFRPSKKPRLSLIVIVYAMPRQAMNTLYSLSCNYQQQVARDDYEIVVVENRSDRCLDQQAVLALGDNFRYILRDETLPTPVHAINAGADAARSDQLCIMVDGARMVTPQLVRYLLMAQRLVDEPVISVPGYHLGEELQQEAVLDGYDETVEQALLASIDWRQNGYRLFEISCLSGTSRSGFFLPIGESNTLGVSARLFTELGGFDTGFTDTGGGQCNLDFYKRAVEHQRSELVLILGEGSFHQFHGGVTTGELTGSERDKMMQRHFDQYKSLRGEYYSPPQQQPIYLGAIPQAAMKYIHHSAQANRRNRGELAYPDWGGELRHGPAKQQSAEKQNSRQGENQ